MDKRVKAVLLYTEGVKTAKETAVLHGVSERSLRRWAERYRKGGMEALKPEKTGPKRAKHSVKPLLEERIISLKQRHPHWGARRIKHQFGLPVHWKTVHNVFRRNGLLIRVKPKPQPCRRFQRYHVDSLWQGDTFQFRIRGVGKVYVTGFTDDCSRYRVVSKAYLRKGKEEAANCLWWALKRGRVPRQIYLDNGRQFIAKPFQEAMKKHGIEPVYGRPYHPRGRGKIERYHQVLHRELISVKMFSSLSDFRRELWWFDRQYNNWRKQEPLGWQTPASVYNDRRYFNKGRKIIKRRP